MLRRGNLYGLHFYTGVWERENKRKPVVKNYTRDHKPGHFSKTADELKGGT